SEYIDVAEGRIAQTCNGTAVMQDLPDFVPASSHHLKPLMRDGSQFTSMLFHPRIDGGVAFESTVESQQFRSHRRSMFAFGATCSWRPRQLKVMKWSSPSCWYRLSPSGMGRFYCVRRVA